MRCLYCGKEIGAFRLLRDSEFCGAPHRKNYGQRLGKALHEIAAPEPPPAQVANFAQCMPLQEGRKERALALWQTGGGTPLKFRKSWPFAVDHCLGQRPCSLPHMQPAVAVRSARNGPKWRAAATPFRLPLWNLAPEPMPVAPERSSLGDADMRLNSATELELMPVTHRAKDIPPACMNWATAPAAGPAASFVRPASALTLADAATPAFSAAIEMPLGRKAPVLAGARPSPAAEPVANFVRFTVALTPISMAHAPRFAAAGEMPSQLHALSVAGPCAAQEPELAASFLRRAAALTPAGGAIALRLQLPGIAAETEPPSASNGPMETPAICLRAMPAGATPVCRFLQSAVASFMTPVLFHAAPPFALTIGAPHVPYIVTPQPAALAEPVMTVVRPRATDVPQVKTASTAAVCIPEFSGLAHELLTLASAAPFLAVEPAESMLVTAQAAAPLPAAGAGCRVPEEAGLVLANPEPSRAPVKGAPGLEPAPLECLLVASAVAAQPSKATARILNLTMPVGRDLPAPGFDAPRLAPKALEPRPATSNAGTLFPIATLSVTAAGQRQELFHAAPPKPGMLPLEFHLQRSPGVVFARPEWKSLCPATLPPQFVPRPAFEKLGAAPQLKPLRQEPDFIKTFEMPRAKKRLAALLVGGKIAAGALLAFSLWHGYSALRGDHRLDAGLEVASVTPPLRSHRRSGGPAAAQAAPAATGPVGWVRQNIAGRASLQRTESFQDGMQSWVGSSQGEPSGWSRHPDGYIQIGALALFRPSLYFKDYRLEFFGQIENKGMSWSVRAKDSQNYHAMKVSVVEAGLRPFVALVHWDVIDGKAGRELRTPLNVMVHNNRPIQVAVNVAGNRLVTSIDGEEIDSFTNETMTSGGVGFFAEGNERARLYWMKVSSNDDWLGHMCAFLSGDDPARATAEVRRPGFPGRAPSPWTPGEENLTFAAAWAGLPQWRAARRARASNIRRTNRWNT